MEHPARFTQGESDFALLDDHSFLKRRLYSSSKPFKLPLLLKRDFQLREIEIFRVAEALKKSPYMISVRDWLPLRMPRSVETSKITA